MNYVNLHGHSTYSFLDGYGTPEQIAERLKSLGQTAAALTDHGNVFGHVQWQKQLTKAGLKPLFGCEFYIVSDISVRDRYDPVLDIDGFPHVTIFALTQKGYENLIKMVTFAQTEGFYRKPRIDWPTLAKHQEGLVVLSGCVGGQPCRLINSQREEDAVEFIFNRRNEIEHYYIELVPEPGLDISHSSLPILIQVARELNIPMVVTSDAHFPKPSDYKYQDLMLAIQLRKKVSDERLRLPDFQYYCSAEELLERTRMCLSDSMFNEEEIRKAIEFSAHLAEKATAEVPMGKPVSFWNKQGRDANDILRDAIAAGIDKRLKDGQLDASRLHEYIDRAKRETDLIISKGFADYILTITDICLWVKQQNGLVMCRGSAGGCLILWILGCSETDSIAHDLSFERFYDHTRPDPPDIDVDFEIKMRGKVIDYIYDKYGKDKCSQIAAITLMRARNSLTDVADAYGIPKGEYTALSQLLDSKDDDVETQIEALTDSAARGVLAKHPLLHDAIPLVGQCRNQTVNAAGMLISADPLDKIIATGTFGKDTIVSSVDKHGAADLGFLKLDILAVAAYDVLADSVRLAGKTMDWLYKLKFDDKGVYETGRAGHVAGVFQLDGAALIVAHQIGLDRFEELYACSALCRPGAMQFVDLYKNNKRNNIAFDNYMSQIHPIAADIVRPTYGVLLYQEQVMRMCKEMAGMDWPTVHKMRKRIAAASFNGHALGSEYGDPFINGCIENGVSQQEAEHWWDAIKAHGIYSFNKAHCVTYGIVGYWMLYMKTYYPEQYFQAFLAHEGASLQSNELLMKRLIKEYTNMGGKMIMLDYETSKATFSSPEPGVIVGGWGNIKGIGSSTAHNLELMTMRGRFKSWFDVESYVPRSVWNALSDSGVIHEDILRPGVVGELAPWMPVQMTEEYDAENREKFNLLRPSELPDYMISNDVMVGGYITARHKKARTGAFKGEQIIYVIEDETGQAIARVPNKDLGTVGIKCREMKLGDYVALRAWWSGDTLYIRDFVKISGKAEKNGK